ncbi:MAG TPA: hypothetical protein DD979_07620, partial [Gammaproteobacteria bacterium]|nr:hypothetical protein [Gammaproteobacteria bacterium]
LPKWARGGGVVIVAFAVGLLGCTDVREELHEPGVYKGRQDPLLEKSGAEQDAILAQRFKSIQTDR